MFNFLNKTPKKTWECDSPKCQLKHYCREINKTRAIKGLFGRESENINFENKGLNKNKIVFHVFIHVFGSRSQKLDSDLNNCKLVVAVQ